MSLSTLPAEALMRIFKYLDAESLSIVSEASREFYRLATHDSLFRHHLRIEPTDASGPPAHLYRRLEALHYPPETRVSVYSSTNTVPFCVVKNTLVLLDLEQSCMIRFPSGARIQPANSLDSAEAMLKSMMRFQSGTAIHVVLPGGHFGFMHEDSGSTRFTVVNVDNGTVSGYPVPGGELPRKDIMPRTELIPAGDNAEWVGYYRTDRKIALIDWRTGQLMRELDMSPEMCFVLAECPQIRGSSLIGLGQEEVRGSTTSFVASMFDGDVKSFSLEYERVLRVLRSADKTTFVVITTNAVELNEFNMDAIDLNFEHGPYFHAFRDDASGEKRWNGQLNMDGYAELRENGRVIQCRSEPFSGVSLDNDNFFPPFRNQYLWIELKDDGTTNAQKVPISFYWTRPVWTRRVVDGTLALFVGRDVPQVFLLRFLENDGSSRPSFVRLEHWTLRDTVGVFLVGEHYLVVRTKGGSLLVRHFNYFCNEQGVGACPAEVEALDEDDDLDWTVFPSSRKKKRRAERF